MADEEWSVAGLVERVRNRDPIAGQRLVAALYPVVIGIVRAHLPRRLAEEDLAQEIFLKVFDRIEQYQPRAGIPFEHWVSRLAVRTCLDALRAERRRPEVRIADLSVAEIAWVEYLTSTKLQDPPETSAEAARGAIEHMLSLLRPEERSVLVWLELEGLSVKQICQLTGWSESAVKVKAFRARGKLKAIAVRRRAEFSP